MNDLIFKQEAYKAIGICMEVHNYLGPGFLEIVYKDALEYEFKDAGILYQREKQYQVTYKDVILPHHFYADFVILNKIILEIKCHKTIINEHVAQAINYLKVSQLNLALIVNFGEPQLAFKRIVV
jgi:GxxExxY protein